VFNGNLSSWNVANAVRFDSMFQSAISFRGDGLNTWNTSRMSSLAYMFSSAVTFRGSISNWDVVKVTSLEAMFTNTGFNGDISAWNVGNVEITNQMFYNNRNFAGNLSAWNTTNLVSAANMVRRVGKIPDCFVVGRVC
jgi:trimeric autotransporter adhesin